MKMDEFFETESCGSFSESLVAVAEWPMVMKHLWYFETVDEIAVFE